MALSLFLYNILECKIKFFVTANLKYILHQSYIIYYIFANLLCTISPSHIHTCNLFYQLYKSRLWIPFIPHFYYYLFILLYTHSYLYFKHSTLFSNQQDIFAFKPCIFFIHINVSLHSFPQIKNLAHTQRYLLDSFCGSLTTVAFPVHFIPFNNFSPSFS